MLWIAIAQPATAVMPCAIGTKTNWPNEPPALTMPLAMPRLSGGASRAVADEQHRRPGEAGAAGGEHADRDDQAEGRRHQRHERGAERDQEQAEQQHAAGAVAVGDDAGDRLRQAPPQLADAERQADARQAEAGGRVDDAQEQAHRLARAHRHREDAAGGEQDQARRRPARRRARASGNRNQTSRSPARGSDQGREAVVEQRVQRGDARRRRAAR